MTIVSVFFTAYIYAFMLKLNICYIPHFKSIRPLFHYSIYLSIYLSDRQSIIHPSIHISSYPYICPSSHPSIHPVHPIYPFITQGKHFILAHKWIVSLFSTAEACSEGIFSVEQSVHIPTEGPTGPLRTPAGNWELSRSSKDVQKPHSTDCCFIF